jgi:hypothetical protein
MLSMLFAAGRRNEQRSTRGRTTPDIGWRSWRSLAPGPFSRAAEELGHGQSSVSQQQLAALERIVGARLVDRGTGPRSANVPSSPVSPSKRGFRRPSLTPQNQSSERTGKALLACSGDFLAPCSRHHHWGVGGAILPVVVDRQVGLAARLTADPVSSKATGRPISAGEWLGANGMFVHVANNRSAGRSIPANRPQVRNPL